jgi:uncharacterized protein YegP (UPF0339 family)
MNKPPRCRSGRGRLGLVWLPHPQPKNSIGQALRRAFAIEPAQDSWSITELLNSLNTINIRAVGVNSEDTEREPAGGRSRQPEEKAVHFEIYREGCVNLASLRGESAEWRWELVAETGHLIAAGDGFKSKAACLEAVELIKGVNQNTSIVYPP